MAYNITLEMAVDNLDHLMECLEVYLNDTDVSVIEAETGMNHPLLTFECKTAKSVLTLLNTYTGDDEEQVDYLLKSHTYNPAALRKS